MDDKLRSYNSYMLYSILINNLILYDIMCMCVISRNILHRNQEYFTIKHDNSFIITHYKLLLQIYRAFHKSF